ncbi:MAG: helix-turn-helix domain-containing protein [Clostridia bacterium]|nr:helix-turn-helix domain-containing protein [Clostridia bacterium]
MRIRKSMDVMGHMEEDEILLIAKVSDALSHPARITLFRYIMQANKNFKPVCNKDLVENFDYAQATISQHMNKLIYAGLVETKKENKFTYYYANLGLLQQYSNAAKKFAIV